MHFHFPFTALEVLWTLTFAAELVLLVVLLGRERIRRFPWFTASIVVMCLHALIARVLYNRMPQLTFQAILITLADIGAVIGLMVLVELARSAFGGAGRRAWIVVTLSFLAVAAAVLKFWGAWPAWKTLTAGSPLAALLGMQLFAQKGELLIGVVTIELGLLIVLFGRRFAAGWRSHTQRIAIGLSTAVISQFAIQVIWQLIANHARPKSREEYEHILGLRDKISNANNALYLAVLVWWIACLWMDEAGATAAGSDPAGDPGMMPVLSGGPPPLEISATADIEDGVE